MKPPLLNNIITKHLPCFFISPHLDDAALSAGSLISYLSTQTSVTVINVFTQAATSASTLSARKHVKLSGFKSATQLYSARVQEDAAVWKQLGVEVINLGFTDALWRKKSTSLLGRIIPEIDHIYPIYRVRVLNGQVSSADLTLISKLQLELKKYILHPNSIVFCPLAIGGHVDHCLVKQAVSGIFDPVYWYDQPYQQKSRKTYPVSFEFPVETSIKNPLLLGYTTQIHGLYPKGLPNQPEKFLQL